MLLEQHFTPVLAELICAAVDLDVAALDLAGALYVARNEVGRAVDELAGKPLLIPRSRQPKVDVISSPGTTARSSKAPSSEAH